MNKIVEKDYKKGVIDVEGSEEFVSKELDKFLEKTKEVSANSSHS